MNHVMSRDNTFEENSALAIQESWRAPARISAVTKRRKCLSCGQMFMSAGPHIRRCDSCSERLVDDGPDDVAVNIGAMNPVTRFKYLEALEA